jgi:general secretion pathway protein K
VDSILDWRDEDSLHRANGAEDDYYRSLPEPYEAKDDDFESVEELLLVKGVTPEMFHGGLKDIVTVMTDKDDKSPAGLRKKRISRKTSRASANRININYAPPEMLESLPQMTPDIVSAIKEFRKEKDMTMADFQEIAGPSVYAEVSPFVTTSASAKSPFYTISSAGKAQGGPVSHSIEIVLKIDARAGPKYEILQWIDRG